MIDIEIQSGKKVVKFYIGKTYVRKNKRSKVFDAMNPNTWRKEGILSRWCHHKQEDYGGNGLVVLTVVTKDDVPQQSIPAFKDQEMYALALEQQLIIHYAFIRGDERLANTSTHPGKEQKEESRAIGYPIYMAFALDDSETDLSNEVQEGDGEGPYIVTNESGSSAGEETTEKIGLTEEREEAIHGALGKLQVAPFAKERLQPAQNSGSFSKRHIHFSKEETICGIDPVPCSSPELPMSNSNDKIDASTQPQDENLLTQNERNPAEADTTHHLSSERKGPFTKMVESSPCQKGQWLTNSSNSSKSRHQLETSNPQHPESVLAEPGDSKEVPIVIDGEQTVMQLEDQGKQLTMTWSDEDSTGRL